MAYKIIENCPDSELNIVKIKNGLNDKVMHIQIDVIYADAIVADIYIKIGEKLVKP